MNEIPVVFEELFSRILSAIGGDTMSDLARALDITPQAVKRAVDSKNIPPSWPLKIAAQRHVSLDWLYFGRGLSRISSPSGSSNGMPAVREDHAAYDGGIPDGYVHLRQVQPILNGRDFLDAEESPLLFRRDWLAGLGDVSQMACFQVSGTQMEPQVNADDLLVFDQSQRSAVDSALCVVAVQGALLVRRLLPRPDRIVLWAAQAPGDDSVSMPTDQSVAWVVGKAVWLGRLAR